MPKSPGPATARSTARRRTARKRSLPPPRVVIEGLSPFIDGGRFPAKRVVGERVTVEADIFTEGHDQLDAVLRFRAAGETDWGEAGMEPLGNDRWAGHFTVTSLGAWECEIHAWVDQIGSWQQGITRKIEAGQPVASELLEGAELVRQAAGRAAGEDAEWLTSQAALLADPGQGPEREALAMSSELADRARRYPDRSGSATAGPIPFMVDRELAAFGAWYEFFPRSAAPEPGRHGTLQDSIRLLPYVAGMGFDVVYLPPIHPIGTTYRKGPNNTPEAGPHDPGSPWAIGGREGGHTAVHPELGTLEDFDQLVARARELNLEVALDIAFQCTPDHPWVTEHPEWFRWRPDGTIQYAENPPKKYQDIYPLNFQTPAWKELWEALRDVVLFWASHGVTVFRVDNPHTKPFAFWQWMIAEVRREHPGVIFLSEAFTRPRVMEYLAKLGFHQSYTYFTWRNTRQELTEYFTELTTTQVREYLRPNLFVNTPDILHEFLQTGGRPAARLRATLAATLAGNYGIYGPVFELGYVAAVPGSEEYLDSEKYQVRYWNRNDPQSLAPFLTRLNQIRRDNPAFRYGTRLRFVPIDNPEMIAYLRTTPELDNIILVVANLDPHRVQTGWVDLPLADLDLETGQQYQVHDLLSDARYLWHGSRNYVALDPGAAPAHVFRLRRRIKTERDFDYFI